MLYVGSTRVLTAAFTADGNLADTTVVLTITAPDGTVTAPTPDHDGVGLYSFELLLDQAGVWRIAWDGEGAVPADATQVLLVHTPGQIGSTCAPWATSADACAPCDDYAIDTVVLDDKMQMATDVLFNLTGRRWPGECVDIIRPQAQYRMADVRSWWPADAPAAPWGWCSCHRGREAGCSTMSEIKLPGHPVSQVTVMLDGAVFTDWRLDDGRYLVRTDGDGWPCCQNMDGDPTADDDTFEVTYVYGRRPPIGGVVAAATLGCQYALACDPDAVSDGRCRLPRNIASKSRAGTTTNFFDPQTLVNDGQVGIAEVDQWVMSVMLGDKRRRATVMVPGQSRSARRPGIRG